MDYTEEGSYKGLTREELVALVHLCAPSHSHPYTDFQTYKELVEDYLRRKAEFQSKNQDDVCRLAT